MMMFSLTKVENDGSNSVYSNFEVSF